MKQKEIYYRFKGKKKKKNFYVKEKLMILTSNHQIIHNMVTNEGQKGEGIY